MAGAQTELKPLVFGPPIDSVPDGGNYDGDVGSLSAIEVERTRASNSLVTRHPLEVIFSLEIRDRPGQGGGAVCPGAALAPPG